MYLALYRKYRPRTFDDVISQEHITTTLKNQIISGSTVHAYLFTGSRGTGKTTCAKILSMAVNCLAPKDGSPCLECERCKEIMDGTTTDIVEMDAASNNGVDDVRQLRDEVAYTPVSCKYRVYIIDEVHMLSAAAFNALLKTIEEPPPHVKFILATTELHKVPATILSRCQRFEFRRVDIADSAERLLEVAEKEGVSLERGAAELISRLSDGGMRDALSVLDRCISADTRITTDVVRECAGVADKKHLFAFTEMIARKDTAGCIRLLGELHRGSKDIALIVSELSEQFRDMMLYKTAPDGTELLNALPDELPELARIADTYTLADILRCITLLQQCADGVGRVKQRKTLAEMCFVRMCAAPETTLEQPAALGTAPAAVRPAAPSPAASAPPPAAVGTVSGTKPAQHARSFEDVEPPPLTDDDAPPLDDYYPIPSPPVPDPARGMREIPVEKPPRQYGATQMATQQAAAQQVAAQRAAAQQVAPQRAVPRQDTAPQTDGLADAPEAITADEWNAAVSKLDFVTSTMLANSTASLANGWLTVRSSNSMLLNNAKDEELLRIEKAVSAALGYAVRLKLEEAKSAPGEQNAVRTPLEELLDKARGLGVEVEVKK